MGCGLRDESVKGLGLAFISPPHGCVSCVYEKKVAKCWAQVPTRTQTHTLDKRWCVYSRFITRDHTKCMVCTREVRAAVRSDNLLVYAIESPLVLSAPIACACIHFNTMRTHTCHVRNRVLNHASHEIVGK